jgi:hypothetical protein
MLALRHDIQGQIDVTKAEAAAAEDKAKKAERNGREGIGPVVWPTATGQGSEGDERAVPFRGYGYGREREIAAVERVPSSVQ